MGDTSTTVVLGWDGLDYEIGSEFGLLDDFAPHHKKIDTFDNPVLGNPSTYEIWPTIITGVEPARHGVRVISDDEGAGISNPVVGRLSNTLHSLLPERTRVGIGLALRNRGISLDQRSPKYYRSKGFTTVFDGRRSRSVGVPNYRTRMDDELDVVSGWGPKMSRHLNIEANEETNQVVYHPETSSERVEEWLVGETERKLAITEMCATEKDHDLVFVWLSYLDTVGHMDPAVRNSDRGWQRRAYDRAVEKTRQIHDELGDEDTLIVVSDHGNQDARHNHNAYFGSTDEDALTGVETVADVKKGIDSVTPRKEEVRIPVKMVGDDEDVSSETGLEAKEKTGSGAETATTD